MNLLQESSRCLSYRNLRAPNKQPVQVMRIFSYFVLFCSTCHPLLMQVALRGRLLKCSNLPRRIFRGSLPAQKPEAPEVTEHGFFLSLSRAVGWPRTAHTLPTKGHSVSPQSGRVADRFAPSPAIHRARAIAGLRPLFGSRRCFPP